MAPLAPISLVKGVVVSKDFHGEHANKVFWPMTSDKFVEDMPLVAAARRDNTEVLLALLHCGADPDAAAACGATALGVACVSGFADVAEIVVGVPDALARMKRAGFLEVDLATTIVADEADQLFERYPEAMETLLVSRL